METFKNEANLLQEISQNSNEIKAVEKKFEEISAMFGNDLKVQHDKVETLEKTMVDLKENLKSSGDQNNFFGQSNQTIEEKTSKTTENRVGIRTELAQGNTLSTELEKTNEKVKELEKMLLQHVSEAKLLMENERLKFELYEAKHIINKQVVESEMKTLKLELVSLKDEVKFLKGQLEKFEMSSRP
jgi:ABC-type transporter Mla subunit MlaD